MRARSVQARCAILLAGLIALACRGDRQARVDESRSGKPDSSSAQHATVAPAPKLPENPRVARAESLYFAGQYDTAHAIWRAALDDPQVRNDSAMQAHVAMWLGLAAWRLGDYADSRLMGERSLSLKQRLRRTHELSRSYNALGLLARDEGRLNDAAALFDSAMRTARAVADTAGVNRGAVNLALVQLDLGEFARARAGFETARASGRAMKDARLEGNALNNLAMLTIKLGDPAAAIPMLDEAGRLYGSIDYGTGQQNMLGQLATAYDLLGEPQRAFTVLDSAMRLARAQKLRQEEANNLRIFAELYQAAGDHRRALDYFTRAAALSRELGLAQEMGIILRSQARSNSTLGRHAAARAAAAEALQIHRNQGAAFEELSDLLLLAELAWTGNDPAGAETQLRNARTLAARLDVPSARADVALADGRLAERAGDWRRVLATMQRAGADLRAARLAAAWEQHALMARAYARLGRLDSAAAAGRLAVAAAERVRTNLGSGALRTTYTAERAAVYGDLAVTLLQLGRADEAFEVADAARGRALLEHLASVRRAVSAPANRLARSEELLKEIDELLSLLRNADRVPARERSIADNRRVSELTTRLERAEAEYEAIHARSIAGDAREAAIIGVRRTNIAEVRRSLSPDEALLQYSVFPDRVLVFVVRRNGVRHFAMPVAEADLSARIRVARELLGKRENTAGVDEVMFGLHDLLVTPVIKSGTIAGARRLVVVPHGALAYLPFAALRGRDSGKYLSDQFAILHLPSAGALPTLRAAANSAGAKSGSTVLAPFPRTLPATRMEAQSIGRTLRRASVLSGDLATEAAARDALQKRRVVHVASHGVLNLQNPLFSRIELAPVPHSPPPNDGRLELREVLDLSVGSSLVFLSGCETGVGAAWSTNFSRGEDYATLGQAFLFSGAKSVVATLWRIDDEGAAAFATRFYRHLKDRAPPEALAQAQREMRTSARFRAPYYWAPYQVTGSGEQIRLENRRWIPFNL
ncbi:MAG TPA: CHAT domain-containing protein [Gemmatimonadaceae bacterium]|nr:CHAT domain-containing protein [Gemmatimonadaceae bacterium]